MSEPWGEALARWAIPEEILAAAPRSPWIMPVAAFAFSGRAERTVSQELAIAALPDGGTVLDVGCGGGRAGLSLVPPAGLVIGADGDDAMLRAFASAADAVGVAHEEVLGRWPDDAAAAPPADVVVCHNLAYNVPDLVGLARALTDHARARVVMQLSYRHPLQWMAPLWRAFWDVARPDGPTADDAADELRRAGLPVHVELWDAAGGVGDAAPDRPWQDVVQEARIRLCLPAERDPDVARAMEELGLRQAPPRRNATLWWDVSAPGARVP